MSCPPIDVAGPAFARYSDMRGARFTLEAGFALKEPVAAAHAPIAPGRLGEHRAEIFLPVRKRDGQ